MNEKVPGTVKSFHYSHMKLQAVRWSSGNNTDTSESLGCNATNDKYYTKKH